MRASASWYQTLLPHNAAIHDDGGRQPRDARLHAKSIEITGEQPEALVEGCRSRLESSERDTSGDGQPACDEDGDA